MFPAAWGSVLAQPFVQLHSELTEILICQRGFLFFFLYFKIIIIYFNFLF